MSHFQHHSAQEFYAQQQQQPLVSQKQLGWLSLVLSPEVGALIIHLASQPACDKDVLCREILSSMLRSGDKLEWVCHIDPPAAPAPLLLARPLPSPAVTALTRATDGRAPTTDPFLTVNVKVSLVSIFL